VAPAPIFGYFLIKRKTRVFPLFMGLYELFTTTLLIFFATATCTGKSYIYATYYIYGICGIY